MRPAGVSSVILETARLYLRQWKNEDYGPFARLNADPEVMEFFPSTLSRADSDALADRCRSFLADRGWGLWALELKTTKEFMGFTGLSIPGFTLPGFGADWVEVGWRLARPFWGLGLAGEAAQAALCFAFDQLALPETVSFTSVANNRSRKLMERLGLKHFACFSHPALPADHPLARHCLYCLDRDTWLAERCRN